MTDWVHLAVLLLFALLVASLLAWFHLYRYFGGEGPPPDSRFRRRWQWLLAAIMALLILLAVVIVLSSDPGDPDDYLFWY